MCTYIIDEHNFTGIFIKTVNAPSHTVHGVSNDLMLTPPLTITMTTIALIQLNYIPEFS